MTDDQFIGPQRPHVVRCVYMRPFPTRVTRGVDQVFVCRACG